MHISALLSASFLLIPALAMPIPTCENILRSSNLSKYSATQIHSLCSIPRSVLQEKQENSSLTNEENELLTLLEAAEVRFGSATEDHTAGFYGPGQQQSLSTSESETRTPQSPQEIYRIISERPRRVRSRKQGAAPFCAYRLGDFQRRTHGFLIMLLSMSEDLAISGAVAVFVVFAILVGVDRWLRAKQREARLARATAELENKLGLYHDDEEEVSFDEKAIIEVTEIEILPAEDRYEARK